MIKTPADAAGLAQAAADDAAAAVFAPLDADNAPALEESEAVELPGLPTLEDLTAEEKSLVGRILSSALGSDQADVGCGLPGLIDQPRR